MTHRVLKSRIAGIADFAHAAETHAAEMTAWKKHMSKVGVEPDHVPYPAPMAHPDVMSAVVNGSAENSFATDYEIVDDGPDAATILRGKKNNLLTLVNVLEMQAKHAILPPGKGRLFSLREGDIIAADGQNAASLIDARNARRMQAREDAIANKSVLKKVVEAVIGEKDPEPEADLTPEEVKAHLAEKRPKHDTEFLADIRERRRRIEEIDRHAAQLQHDIEDLTADNIDDWKPAPFPQ